MKLITLNIWGGHINESLLKFIQKHQDIDVFCLQEVYHQAPNKISDEDRWHNLNAFSDIAALLPEHQGFFRPLVNNIYGIACFVKKTVDVLSEGEVIIHQNLNYPGSGPTHSRNLQWVECKVGNKEYVVINVHGLWNGKGKTDSPERLQQTERIKDFMNTLALPKILCGDFNLRPDTDSMKILEQDMVNLIKHYGVTSTRTSLYPKEEKFADYILLSKDINVEKFEVLADEVSDHAPLYLECH